MKKLLALSLAFSACFALAACEDEETPTPPVHEHSYASEWSKDADNHWHACTGTDCTEASDKAAHTWNDGEITTQPSASADGVKTFTCTVCTQTKTESVVYVPTPSEIWQNAFDNSKITNCTVRLEDPSNGTILYKVATIDGDRVVHLSNSSGMNYYLVYTADGKYVAYMKSGEDWTKQEFDQPISVFEMCSSYAAVCPNFGAYFTEFEYDEATGSYIFNGVEDVDELQTNDIMTNSTAKYYNAAVKIVDGKLVQVTSSMSGQNGKTDVVYFENYGMTVIELPTVD